MDMNMDMDSATLDRNALRLEAEEILASLQTSIDGCGSSYELFQRRFSAAVERARRPEGMSEDEFLAIARTFDYATAEEIAEGDRESGSCSHGFDPNCCPCGCGDIDNGDDDWDSRWDGYEEDPESEPEPAPVEAAAPASFLEAVSEIAVPGTPKSAFSRLLGFFRR